MKFSKIELKILVYRKMKEGKTYKEAYDEVARDIEQLKKVKKNEF